MRGGSATSCFNSPERAAALKRVEIPSQREISLPEEKSDFCESTQLPAIIVDCDKQPEWVY